MNLNELCGQLVASVLDHDDTTTADHLAEILNQYDFPARRVDTDVIVEAGAHEIVITARQARQIAVGAVMVSDETELAIPITAAVRAQMHLLVGLLTEVADCGRMHALVEVVR